MNLQEELVIFQKEYQELEDAATENLNKLQSIQRELQMANERGFQLQGIIAYLNGLIEKEAENEEAGESVPADVSS